MNTELKPQDLAIGKTYRAKKPARTGGILYTFVNDRQIMWVSADFAHVQYDSAALPNGRHYPRVTMEAFLKWASHEVQLERQDEWMKWDDYEKERRLARESERKAVREANLPKAPPDAPKTRVIGAHWPWN